MRWLRRRKQPVDLSKGPAAEAAKAAEHRLSETNARWPEIQSATSSLAHIRQRNHLAEAIREAVLGGEQ